jgi:hypothetical protein
MNIATARRGRVPQGPLPPPADHVTREGGFLCPVCLEHGREACTRHRETAEPPSTDDGKEARDER